MPKLQIKAKFTGPIFNGKFKGIMRKIYKDAITELVLTGETLVSEGTPVGVTGFARAGIQGKVIRHNLGAVQATGPGAKYIDVIEGGRASGRRFPPVDEIMLWVRRKLRVPPSELKSVTYLVGRKIAKKGIKGKFMFAKAERKMVRRIRRRIELANTQIEKKLSD